MADQTDHREQVIRLLTQLNERQRTIFNRLAKIDKHFDKINGTVAEHEKELTVIMTWGAMIVIVVPIVLNLIMK
jgi:DNA anti-recombination protein RmuC|tara:strand:+ start:5457 stop:5678 length:222 start_codon:yes stop_codon:yes gene_type:complete